MRKGEHGHSICIPLGCKADEPAEGGAGEQPDIHFGSATVFDISQTDPITEEPIATVSPEVAQAFGMTDLPNVRVEHEMEVA